MRLAAAANKPVPFVLWRDAKGEAGLLVRRIPADVAKEIEDDVFGTTRKVKVKKGVQLIDHDPERSEEVVKRKAAYALVDSFGNAELPAEDVPALDGAVDGFVKLDGRWSPEVKAQVFAAHPDIAIAAVQCAEKLEAKAVEDEEGKGWTS